MILMAVACWSGPGSVVGIATVYGLDGLGFESWWGWDFPQPSRPAVGPPSLLNNGYLVFLGGKEQLGHGVDPTPPSSAMVKKEYSCTSTPPMGRTAYTEPQCLYKGAVYLFYIRVTYMSESVCQCGHLSWHILKLCTGWGQIVCFKLQPVYIQCKSALLCIEQEAGWAAEPVQLLWRKEKKNLPPPPPKWNNSCVMASRLDAVLITGSRLSMIRTCSCNISLIQWLYSCSWCCMWSILRCKCIYREVSLRCFSVPGKMTEYCLILQHGCFCSCVANTVFILLQDDPSKVNIC